MKKTTPSIQAERTEASRRALVDAAIELLATDGYRAMTTSRIQEQSGLSRGLVGYHFGTKVRLLEAVVERLIEGFYEDTADEYKTLSTGLDKVIFFIKNYFARYTATPASGRSSLVLAAESISSTSSEIRPAMHHAFNAFQKALETMIREGQTDGSVRSSVDPTSSGVLLQAMLRGMVLQDIVSGVDLKAVAKEAETSVRLMLQSEHAR